MQGVTEGFIGANGEASLSGRALIKRAQVPRPEYVSTVTPRHRMLAQAELAQRIEDGTVGIGPLTHHEPIAGMHSDQRDPETLGLALLGIRADDGYGWNLSEYYDDHTEELGRVPAYQEQFTDHSTLRLKELQERAEEGDRFASALLAGDTLAEEPVD